MREPSPPPDAPSPGDEPPSRADAAPVQAASIQATPVQAAPAPEPARSPPLRRVDNSERFVAFAFAAADLAVEVEADGRITYSARAGAIVGRRPA